MKINVILLLLLGATSAYLGAQATSYDTVTIPGSAVAFALSPLPGGTFGMGEDRIPVTLSPFSIGAYEVTHDEYRLFQRRENDSDEATTEDYEADGWTRPSPPYLDLTYGMGGRGGFPQVNTTQQAALRYCEWLYEKTGRFFRLPTEAEWEYACLAGREAPEDGGWLSDNAEETYHKTGELKPNPWGLFDMIGNVSEWTLDQYVADYPHDLEASDPWVKPSKKHSRTVRGGHYYHEADEVGCRVREKSSPKWQARDPQIPRSVWWNVDAEFLGFRIVSPEKQPTKQEVAAFFAEAIVN